MRMSDPRTVELRNDHCRPLFRFFSDSYERLIRVIECEHCNVRTDMEVMSDLEKVARILPSHSEICGAFEAVHERRGSRYQ